VTGSFPAAEMPITGHTRVAGVIGWPARHSKSPALHNAAFRATGLDWVYGAFDVGPGHGRGAVEAMRTLGLAGLSVTMPHKEAAARFADRRTAVADRLGVANTLFWDGEELVADSTDGDGFVAAFEYELGRSSGTGFDGATVAVIGAGGAARSIVEALGRSGAASILVANRSSDKAVDAARLAPQAVPVPLTGPGWGDISVDVIVNATAVGMAGGPAPGVSPVPTEAVRADQVVVDIVYEPERTSLLTMAEEVGATTVGGLGMLIHQAALQFERWTGKPAPIDVMRHAAGSRV
jgi:shikimate dehydrogenase